MAESTWLDGTLTEVLSLADLLMRNHAVPEDEATVAQRADFAARSIVTARAFGEMDRIRYA